MSSCVRLCIATCIVFYISIGIFTFRFTGLGVWWVEWVGWLCLGFALYSG